MSKLRPPVFVLGSIAAAILILLGSGWGVNEFIFQPKEATRQARITAQAAAQATAVRQTEDGLATSVAAAARILGESIQTTRIAQTVYAQITATIYEANTQATATAQSVEFRCQDIRRYALDVSTPTISPRPGTLYVVGNPMQAVHATWIVTNTGECAWNAIGLRTWPHMKPVDEGTRASTFQVRRDGGNEEGASVAPGDAIEVVVYFSVTQAQHVSQEWVLRVNDLPALSEQPRLRLEAENWFIPVTHTSTLTKIPVPTRPPPTSDDAPDFNPPPPR